MVTVLPCIGSQSQLTGCPASRTAATSAGSRSPTVSAPIREMRVRRPGERVGSSRSQRASRSETVIEGPTLQATGLAMEENSSTWAPSSERVRSPIHGRWVEESQRAPEPSRRSIGSS